MSYWSEDSFDDLDGIEKAQRLISILLYTSMISHMIGFFLNDIGWLTGLVPGLKVVTAVTIVLYFFIEALLLPPVGLAIMPLVAGILLFVLPYIFAFLLGLMVGSIIMLIAGGIIMALSTGLVIVLVDGVIMGR